MKLTDPQVIALGMLSRKRCYTGPRTCGEATIAGNAAKALVKTGLATYVSGWQVTGSGSTVVQITDAGKRAFEAQPKGPHDHDLCPCGHPPKTPGPCAGCNCGDPT